MLRMKRNEIILKIIEIVCCALPVFLFRRWLAAAQHLRLQRVLRPRCSKWLEPPEAQPAPTPTATKAPIFSCNVNLDIAL